MLQHELSRLVEAELLYQRGLLPHATYIFKHALIRDSAYASLLRSTRQQYHQRIAHTLEDQFPETAENQPELLAYHYTEACLLEPAITYWYQAGQRLVEHLAPREAIAYLSKGLELLKTLPDNPARLQQELRLLTALGPAVIATKGPAAREVESVYTRAHTLCQQVADNAHTFPVLRGLCNFYLVRKDLWTARALAEQLLHLGHHDPKASHLTEAHSMLGTTLLFLGAVAPALAHFDQCLTRYDAQHAPFTLTLQDPGIGYLSYRARTLWCLGYPDQALACMQEALTRAQQGSYPHSLISCQVFMALVSWLRHEPWAAQEHAEAGIGGAREQGFQFQGGIRPQPPRLGVGHAAPLEAGMADIYQGITDLKAAGASALHGLVYLIEACAQVGRVDEGLTVLAEALTLVDQNDERLLESHLHRLKGELLLQQSLDNQSEAASRFHHALAIAQNQSAKSWELRAATSLAKLWQQQGKCHDAYDLLTPVYNWFTEGFDTADLMDARALLDEVS